MRRSLKLSVWFIIGSVALSSVGCADDASDLARYEGASVSGRCFVVFVHGRGDDRRGWSQQALEAYWAPDADGDGALDSRYSMTRYAAQERGCEVLRVGYDGSASYWAASAAGEVARQTASWIDERGIGEGELLMVAHSMGGVVARWIVNQGEQGAPYYDYGGAPYSRVTRALRALVTIQAPHTGSEAADAMFGEADNWYSRRAADLVDLFGIESSDAAASAMRRASMEAAGGSGGFIADHGRTTRMYTVAGYSTFDGAGVYAGWMSQDTQLAIVWGSLCNRSHAINLWVCREDPGEAGDGLVEEWSAAGRFQRTSDREGVRTRAGAPIQGARSDWLHVEHNHNQGRFDWLSAQIRDTRSGEVTDDYLGSYLGARIRSL